MNNTIFKPVFSEKSNRLERLNKYTLKVNIKYNKKLILKELSQVFSLNIKKINIITVRKIKTKFKNRQGFTNAYKKIVLTSVNKLHYNTIE